MRKWFFGLCIGCFMGMTEGSVCAAVSVPGRDTIGLNRENVLSRPTIFLPDNLIRDTLQYEYSKIKNVAYKSSFTKELYKMIFVNPRPNRVNVMRTQNSEDRFTEYAGKKIKEVNIKVLPPYGTSVYDTTYSEQDLGWLKNIANKIHMKSADRVLRRQLTLKPGMRLMPFEVVQNEILLRRLDYIDDATIMVNEDKDNPEEVILTVICKDQFSWGAEISSNFLNNVKVGVINKNFMRLGHIVEYDFSYRGTKDQKWGNTLRYKVNSVFGTHFDIDGYYQNDYSAKQIWGQINRQFLTSRVKWAGGVTLSRVYRADILPDVNIEHLEIPFNYHAFDVWLGRSFLWKTRHRYNRNFYITGRFLNTIFNSRPTVSSDSNQFYYNRRNYFASFIFRKLKYYKANLIYDFGRTEDIPSGFYSALTFGYENNDFQNSGYIGYEARYSHFDFQTERLYSFDVGLGSYVNGGGFERGLFKLGLHHISNLQSLGSWRFRFYNDINYVTGIRRYPTDYLYFEDYDILGFNSDTLRGNQKLSTSLSATFFLPYIKKGFRMALTGFVDLGAIAQENSSIFKSRTYWGLGVAVNLRNDNIVFKNISLRLSFYPSPPNDMRGFQASMSGNLQNGFYDFQVYRPRVIEYR